MKALVPGPLVNLYVSYDVRFGRGIYAGECIRKGVLIDRSFSWEMTPEGLNHFAQIDEVGGYWFGHPDKAEWGLLPIGLIELMNHSKSPNCIITWTYVEPMGYIGEVYSSQVIGVNTQVRLDYGISLPADWLP